MKTTFILVSLTMLLIACAPNKELENEEQTLSLSYVGYKYRNEVWVTEEMDSFNFKNKDTNIVVFLQPSHDTLIIPDKYWESPCGGGTHYKLTGKFQKEDRTDNNIQGIRITKFFIYTKYEFVQNEFQKRRDSIFNIKGIDAYCLIYELPIVKKHLSQKEYNYEVSHLTHCPGDTDTSIYYYYELHHFRKDIGDITDEKIRLHANDSIFEIYNKETLEYEILK